MSLRSLNFRLAALFSALFIVFSLVLFGFTYVLLSSALGREQQEEMRARMLEFWALYHSYGLDLLNEEVFSERTSDRILPEWRLYLIRVADKQNRTLFLYVPAHWRGYNTDELEEIQPPQEGGLIRLGSKEDGGELEIASLRLHDGNVFQIGINIKKRTETLQRFRQIFLLVAIPLLVLGFLGGLIFSRRSLRPIHRLIQVTRSIIDTGKMDTRIPARGIGDELDELVLLFNRMLEKIETLIRAMREALDNVAHDLRTPMTRMVGKVQMTLQSHENTVDESQNPSREALQDCLEESEGILTMLNTLMDISEAETGVMRLEKQFVNISSLVEDITELYRYAAQEKDVNIKTSLPGELYVSLDVNRMRQVLANLLDNAIKYTAAGGIISIEVSCRENEAVVVVNDTGIGIPNGEIQYIWDRLYRGDRSRSKPGLGLGLSLVQAIVRAHMGSVSVASKVGEGSQFTITLPLTG
jgi:signal transduction histidine kinase